ncbi:hypothetical protein SUGI_0346370 [Cryptomeria japonica]|nr:hypothetical protein SUGI_0346370 [Cryptomeria japonica]
MNTFANHVFDEAVKKYTFYKGKKDIGGLFYRVNLQNNSSVVSIYDKFKIVVEAHQENIPSIFSRCGALFAYGYTIGPRKSEEIQNKYKAMAQLKHESLLGQNF